jgi:hypothetical protein
VPRTAVSNRGTVRVHTNRILLDNATGHVSDVQLRSFECVHAGNTPHN